MVKKKISGQTIAIIVLVVLLACAIAFGGVYAFYSTNTNKVSGTIVMANLFIDYKYDDPSTDDGDDNNVDDVEGVVKGQSGKSEILITNMKNIVPNELLGNSPLRVVNKSTDPIYLVVLYRVQKATAEDDKHIDDIYRYKKQNGNYVLDENDQKILDLDKDGNKQIFGVIDIGTSNEDSIWADFVFNTTEYEEYANDKVLTNDNYVVRCYITKAPQIDQEITVIEKNQLRMHRDVGNEFQNQSISFTFQAHAIGADSFQFDENTTEQQKYSQIVKAIYQHNGYMFNI